MAVIEVKARRGRHRTGGDGWTGWAYRRIFRVPKGQVATALDDGGDLARGSVLPVKWGGVATSKAEDPRLQTVTGLQQRGGALDELSAVYITVDVESSSTYSECYRSRPEQRNQHEIITRTVGVALLETTTGIPALGDFLDDDDSNVLGPVCADVHRDETTHFGRVFIRTTWIELQPAS